MGTVRNFRKNTTKFLITYLDGIRMKKLITLVLIASCSAYGMEQKPGLNKGTKQYIDNLQSGLEISSRNTVEASVLANKLLIHDENKGFYAFYVNLLSDLRTFSPTPRALHDHICTVAYAKLSPDGRADLEKQD